MAIVRETRIIDGQVVQIERDAEMDAYCQKFQVARDIQHRLGFNLDSRHASTVGVGKHTGAMGRAVAAKGFKGAITNKAWRERRRVAQAKELVKIDDRYGRK